MDPAIEKFLRFWDTYREMHGTCQSRENNAQYTQETERALRRAACCPGADPRGFPARHLHAGPVAMPSVTVRVEWEMGHRLPNHNGRCYNLHGHHYIADVTVEGPIKTVPGQPDEGIVVDFSEIKALLRGQVALLDHKFLLSALDPLLPQLMILPGVVAVPYIPTAENIALTLLWVTPQVKRVRLYETPTSYAEVER
ncbi:MAG: 6-carboxytetrahydropterin synthase [Bryobacteraceae bacterium]